ncbi:Poly(U)-specific endoribonuclease-B [Merluccius polli]|uniref:Uridylate-specific endoribonuclease n=1 Tax=Merluccius polli TaxID=89951 RepID=A0AA47N7C7_MERPO|nr:Poly(U)-specific endoribonuclease-B [Merluccius polli]
MQRCDAWLMVSMPNAEFAEIGSSILGSSSPPVEVSLGKTLNPKLPWMLCISLCITCVIMKRLKNQYDKISPAAGVQTRTALSSTTVQSTEAPPSSKQSDRLRGQDIMVESDRELSSMAQALWDNDVNRLQPGKDYRISLQGKAGEMAMNDDNDGAGFPLFTFVDENIFKKETFLAFISLLDNYVSDTGEPEIVTPEEEAENHKFLDSLVQTPTMKIAHKYLVEKHLSPENEKDFKKQLYRIWFELYARKGSSRPDSSGFEHVFVGETRGGRTVIGFHNWIQLYLQEKLGHIDYKGYSVNANSPQPDENKHIMALQFSWKNGIKPKGSIFIGVSPEFEFALYTLCFLSSPNEHVKVQFSLYDVEIVCHHYNQKHIGTTYPMLVRYQNPTH